MRVILAGYNVDTEVLAALRAGGAEEGAPLTPETISAAYARISRNPSPVNELRRLAREDVAKARASNEQIVYGFGHASVAEHAVFNFDLLGLSRLAIEAVEHSRLCSYTEKSQRYIRLRDDHVVPQELSDAGLAGAFTELVALQNRTYHLLYEKLREHVFAQNPGLAKDKSQRRTLEGWAKEDARYVTSLATEGQLGMTLNARNLEAMIRRLAGHPLAEARQLAAALQAPAVEVAPSLIRHVEPRHDPAAAEALYAQAAEALEHEVERTLPGAEGAVQLTHVTPEGDQQIVAALLHGVSRAPWTACHARAQSMSQEQRAQIMRAALQPMGPHDSAPRCFELVACQFDLVLSAACFGQLKRHRMATILVQPYDPSLGYTVPEAVSAVGLSDHFAGVMTESARCYERALDRCGPEVAEYALTQAHRRRVLVRLNGRELYHFSRLRQDAHAQWDIRNLAHRMIYLAQQELPLTLMLAAGKDSFATIRSEVYGDDG
jgi:flavin-dependent thymidylate synthase